MQVGISPCNYLWCSDLESLFYTPIFCVGEPVLLPHRARCRWGHRLPVMFLVLSYFFRRRSRGKCGPHLIIYLWRFGRRVSFFLYTRLVCLCCCFIGQDAGGYLTCGGCGLELLCYTHILCVSEPVLLPRRVRCRWGHHLAVMFWSRVAFFTHSFCVGEPVLLLHRARCR